MTTIEVLRKARALYEANPSHAGPGEPVAEGCVCLIWALDLAGKPGFRVGGAYAAMTAATGTNQFVAWNAEHSTAEVLAAFDRAIEASS